MGAPVAAAAQGGPGEPGGGVLARPDQGDLDPVGLGGLEGGRLGLDPLGHDPVAQVLGPAEAIGRPAQAVEGPLHPGQGDGVADQPVAARGQPGADRGKAADRGRREPGGHRPAPLGGGGQDGGGSAVGQQQLPAEPVHHQQAGPAQRLDPERVPEPGQVKGGQQRRGHLGERGLAVAGERGRGEVHGWQPILGGTDLLSKRGRTWPRSPGPSRSGASSSAPTSTGCCARPAPSRRSPASTPTPRSRASTAARPAATSCSGPTPSSIRAPAGPASPSRPTPRGWNSAPMPATAWSAPRSSAPAAAPTSATSSPTAPAPPASATASTAWPWTSTRGRNGRSWGGSGGRTPPRMNREGVRIRRPGDREEDQLGRGGPRAADLQRPEDLG